MYKRLASTPDTVSHDLYNEPDTKKKQAVLNNSSTSPSTPKRTSCPSNDSSPTSSISSSFPCSPLRSTQHKAWLYQNGSDVRFDAEHDKPVDDNWMYDEDYDMWGLPYNCTGALVKPDPKDNMVTYIIDIEDYMIPYINAIQHDWPEIGQTFPPTISLLSKQPITKPKEPIESIPTPNPEPTPTQHALDLSKQLSSSRSLLQNLVFCGNHQPCPCLPQLSQHQATFLPLHCPLKSPPGS